MISNKIKDGIVGKINIPSDKSISHRSIIIPSISMGITEINNLLMSDDVIHTLNAFKALGVKIEKLNNKMKDFIHNFKRNIFLSKPFVFLRKIKNTSTIISKLSDNPSSRWRIEVMSMWMLRFILRAPDSDIPRQFTKLSLTNAVAGIVLRVLSKFWTFTVVRSMLITSPSTP